MVCDKHQKNFPPPVLKSGCVSCPLEFGAEDEPFQYSNISRNQMCDKNR